MSDKLTMGLKETKEAVDFAIALGMGVDQAMADKKITVADIPFFFPAFMKLVPAIDGADQIALEFKLASEDEINELKSYLKEKLDLRDDQLEKFIEDAFGLVLTVWLLVKTYFLKPVDNVPEVPEVQ